MAFMIPATVKAAAGITYYGRLMTSSGQPVTASSVTFKMQIRTPGNENCLLYEEQQVKDLSVSKGIFALTLNDGTATVVNVEPQTIDRAFQNRGTFTFGAGKCAVGTVYTPNPADGRKLVVEFNDGSFAGWEQMPAQAINFVPMSLEALTVGGFNATNLVRVVDGSGAPAVVSPLTQTQHNALMDLVSGTSPAYLSPSSPAVGFTGSLSGDVTGLQGATVVTRIQGRAVDTAAPSNGQALVWSAGNNRWEPGTVSGGASDWSTLSGKPATFPSDWSTLSSIPATFSPSAHSHPITQITSASGEYFAYTPNGSACSAGEVLKWDTGGGGRWICGTDAGAAGTLVSLTVNAPIVKTGTASDPVLSMSDASTSAKGVVQLATSADTSAGLVIQASDTRLTDGRAPTGVAGGELAGSYPNPTVVASATATGNSLVRRDGSGGIVGNAANFNSLALTNGASTLTLSTPVAFTTYSTKLPASAGTNGQVMTSNGTDMIWSNSSSIIAGNVSGTVAIANGGTGATTASAARTNLGLTATGDALATATDAAAGRAAISAMLNVTPGTAGNVLTSNGTSWTSAPFTVNAANVGSSVGGYFTYKPNNGACANGEVLKWETAGGGRWVCGTDVSSTGGTGVGSVSATAPVTVDNTDPNNPRVEIDNATTSSTGVVQLATSSDTSAGLAVQADDTRLTNSRAPTGAAGGDLAGTYPNPTIAKLQTKDITLTALASGNILKYDGAKWVNAAPTDADTLGGMSCSSGDVALYNGSTWTCVNASVSSANNAIVRRNGSGQIQSASADFGALSLNNGGGSVLTLAPPAAFTSYTLKLPASAGTSGQVMTSNGTDMVWSSLSNATTSAKGVMQVGTGLAVSSGVVSADFGTGSGKVAQGNDSRFPSSTCATGSLMRWDGSAWVCETVPGDSNKVSRTGDTMSGSLTLSAGSLTAPANGLVIGTNQLVASGGKVGIGTASPVALLSNHSSNLLDAASVGTNGTSFSWSSPGSGYAGAIFNSSTGGGLLVKAATNSGTIFSVDQGSSAATAGTALFRVLGNGNVGIGASSPGEKLEIAGAIKLGASSGNANGTIQWDGTDFLGRKGGTWVSLTSGSGGSSDAVAKTMLDTYSVGNRSSLITVTSDWPISSGTVAALVDGDANSGYMYFSSGSIAGKYLRFQLNQSKVLTGMVFSLYYVSFFDPGTTFKVQGSNNGTTWTDLSPNISAGAMGPYEYQIGFGFNPSLLSFTYYQILGVSGSVNNSPYVYEVNFEVAQTVTPASVVSTLSDTDGDTKLYLEKTADEDKIRFDTAGVERLTIGNSGNVGIGVTNPTAKLEIGGVAGTDGIKFPDGTLQKTAAGGSPVLRFTRTAVAYNASAATKIAQCVTDFGSEYDAAKSIEVVANFRGAAYSSAINFVVADSTVNRYNVTSYNVATNSTGTEPVACIHSSAALRFTSGTAAYNATNTVKDNLCVSEFGSTYQAASLQDVTMNWGGLNGSPNYFVVYGNTSNRFGASGSGSGVTIAANSTGTHAVACIHK